MDLLGQLGNGFLVALSLDNLFYCFAGVLIGTLVGVLPGIGPIAAMSLLLPATFAIEPTGAVIMLAGIYYGSMYGGSTTSILVRIPGEAASVVTCLDGHEMAKQGRAGAALFVAAIGSFFAGTVATLVLAMFAPPLAELALKFGPAEYFSLMTLGLVAAVVLAHGSLLKAIGMTVLGLLLGLIGTDVNSGMARYTFDLPELADGINFVIVAMGIYGLGEVIRNLEDKDARSIVMKKVTGLMPTMDDLKRCTAPILRGTGIGCILGILPGGGTMLSSFAAYSIEKKVSKNAAEFGHGAIEGVAGPEAANNASAAGVLVPLLTLGLPTSATAAIMLAAFQNYGLQPGPMLFINSGELVWGLIASLYVGNLMLLILNLPLAGLWVRLLFIPRPYLYAGILIFSLVGIWGVSNSIVDLVMMLGVGVLGYVMRVYDFPIAPVLIGLILGPMAEVQLRRALAISQGDPMVLVSTPLSATLMAIAVLIVAVPAALNWRRTRKIEPLEPAGG